MHLGLKNLFIALVMTSACWGQGAAKVKELYTKYEYRIPMRDGKRLFTSVYVPKDDSEPSPILMSRTPYTVAPYGVDKYKTEVGPSAEFGKLGKYIFVYQDVRGKNMSEGEFINMTPHKPNKGPLDVDESSDTYDTIEWLVKNIPNNNGRVGTWGISYPGFYTAAGMIDAHPAHKAASPQAPITDWFTGDDFHRNGALFLPHAFNFLIGFGKPRPEPIVPKNGVGFDHGTPDGYKFFLNMGPLYNANEKYYKNEISFWNDMMTHGTYDEFWQTRNLRPHLKGIKPAVMTVGGWFDAENLYGALNVYRNVERTSPGTQNILVMGPWRHGGWARDTGEKLGDVSFNSKTAEFYRQNIELPFFDFHLRGKGEMKLPEAFVFETGTNVWKKYDAWPPKGSKQASLYLQAGGKLSFTAPKESAEVFDEYVSDPAKPVPFINSIAVGMTVEYMLDDQRFASSRPDVLVYQTDALEEDVTMAGPLRPELFVSTTGTDSDWIVKLIDVYPDDFETMEPDVRGRNTPKKTPMNGYQELIRGEVFRGKFRNSFSNPEPFVPGKVTPVAYDMNDINHTFRRGHRIMVQIQSSWFPLVDRNPQKFTDIYTAKESDFIKATQHVYRGGGKATQIKVTLK